jgi:hypothetical protein
VYGNLFYILAGCSKKNCSLAFFNPRNQIGAIILRIIRTNLYLKSMLKTNVDFYYENPCEGLILLESLLICLSSCL